MSAVPLKYVNDSLVAHALLKPCTLCWKWNSGKRTATTSGSTVYTPATCRRTRTMHSLHVAILVIISDDHVAAVKMEEQLYSRSDEASVVAANLWIRSMKCTATEYLAWLEI